MNAKLPPLRFHKPSGQGFVILCGKYIYLGAYDAPETHLKYERTLAEWLAAGRQLPTTKDQITIKELLCRHVEWCQGYYNPTGNEHYSELDRLARATRVLRRLYGETRVVEFGPLALQAVRQKMIELGWCRRSINAMVNRIKAMFRWGVAQELIPASTYHALSAVTGLRFGRTIARESQPVKSVPLPQVEAIRPFLSRQVRALVDLQLLTGARGGEILGLQSSGLVSRPMGTQRKGWQITVAGVSHTASRTAI